MNSKVNQTKKTLKILIMGITGDYSKRKILPSIAQFISNYGDKVSVEILGYSRSVIKQEEITKILCEDTNLDAQNLPKITLETGQYSDITFFANQVETLDENEKLICYLALPPSVYLGFLDSICFLNQKDFTVLIEKPFGQNLAESELLLQSVMNCHLYYNVFFVDHFLFKPASRINLEYVFNRYNLKFEDLESVQIKALETLGVEGRFGYYDSVGAVKDMLPHLYSLFKHLLKELFVVSPVSLWQVTDHETKQYSGYLEDLQSENKDLTSTTETYFKTTTKAYFAGKTLDVIFESGKKQTAKETEIILNFQNYKVNLNFAPHNSLTIYKDNQKIQTIPILDTFYGDHERMFKDILENNYNYFVKADKIIEYWQIIDKIESFKKGEDL